MSCYNWERGTIILPSKIFASFRREYINKYNVIQNDKLSRIKSLYHEALRQGKGKRKYSFFDCMVSLINHDREYDLIYMLFPNGTERGVKPRKPTKKIMNFVNGTDFTFDIDNGNATIAFDKKRKEIHWYVGENNHAVESAHETKEAQALFGMLHKVKWTNGSGGEFYGNDEYNSDSDCSGGGGNYTTATYGKQ